MNKKDLAKLKKELKLNNEGKVQIGNIYNMYCKKDNHEIIYSEKKEFNYLDEEMKDMLIKNFKKTLTGDIDKKIFDLQIDTNKHNSVYNSLLKMKNEGVIIKQEVEKIAHSIMENYSCDSDFIISFLNVSIYLKNTSKNLDEDTFNKNDFIMCTINKATLPKRTLKIDLMNQNLIIDGTLDTIMNLNPLQGIIFPSINDGYADVNKVIYYKNETQKNLEFIEKILPTHIVMTAEKEKDIFIETLRDVIGNKIKSEDMYYIYNAILESVDPEDDTELVVSTKTIEKILVEKGYKNSDNFNNIVKKTTDVDNYEFKIDNIVPQKNNSLKIKDDNIDISLSCKELNRCKQIVKDGKKCLLIELNEDVQLEGFAFKAEEI